MRIGEDQRHGASSCESCDVGKFTSKQAANEKCEFCTDEILGSVTKSVGTTSVDGCICPAKKFKDSESGHCVDIPPGVNETVLAMDLFSLVLQGGWFRTSSSSLDIRQCPLEEQCLGGDEPQKSCLEGSTGPYCQVCDDGFSGIGTTSITCVKCEESGGSNYALMGAILVVLLLTVYLCCFKSKKKKKGSRQRSSTLSEKAELAEKKFEKLLKKIRVPLKILMAYFQISSSFSFNFGLKFPSMFTGLMAYLSFTNFDFVSLVPVGCMVTVTYHYYLVGYTVGSLGVGGVLSIGYWVCGKGTRSARKEDLQGIFFSSFLT